MQGWIRCNGWLVVLCAATGIVQAQTDQSYAMLLSAHPPAIQAGTSADITVTSFYHQRDAYQVLISGSGLRAEPLPEPTLKPGEKLPANRRTVFRRTYRFTASADAEPGVREFRVVTSHGVSTLGQLAVCRDPVIAENQQNDTLETAQQLTLPVTLCGALERPEDVDYYRFQVRAGTSLTCFVRAAALQNKLHDFEGFIDPQLTLFNAAGDILATANNTVGSGGDSLLSYNFAQSGEYRLQLRDVRYKGHPEWVYALEIHDRPFVTQTFPPIVQPAHIARLTPFGFGIPSGAELSTTIPSMAETGIRLVTGTIGGRPTNEFPVLVSPHAALLESSLSRSAEGQTLPVPAIVAGRVETGGEIDRYAFVARKGERYTVEAFARRCRSPLDAILRIVNARGAMLAENDDQNSLNRGTSDSQIENWIAPADGRYHIEIRDLNRSGGPAFVYALQLMRSVPNFRLELESDKSHLSPGLSYPIYVHADRRAGFTGPIRLAASDLPPGVTAQEGTIPAGAIHGCVIVTAALSAPRGVANVRITGTANVAPPKSPPQEMTVSAMPLGDVRTAGRPLFVAAPFHSVSVGPPQNIRSVTLSTTDLRLKPGESRRVEVTVERVPEYTGIIRLESYVHYFEETHATSLPPGVVLDLEKSKGILSGTENRGWLVFRAEEDARPTVKQLVPVMAQVAMSLSIRFNYCQPLWIAVEPAPAKKAK
jgi:hypothetical protein